MEITVFLKIYVPVSPVDREVRFAAPFDEILKKVGGSCVTGGGTKFHPSGQFEFCYLEILTSDVARTRNLAKAFFLGLDEPIRWEL
jgi:hypothetical protein